MLTACACTHITALTSNSVMYFADLCFTCYTEYCIQYTNTNSDTMHTLPLHSHMQELRQICHISRPLQWMTPSMNKVIHTKITWGICFHWKFYCFSALRKMMQTSHSFNDSFMNKCHSSVTDSASANLLSLSLIVIHVQQALWVTDLGAGIAFW